MLRAPDLRKLRSSYLALEAAVLLRAVAGGWPKGWTPHLDRGISCALGVQAGTSKAQVSLLWMIDILHDFIETVGILVE